MNDEQRGVAARQTQPVGLGRFSHPAVLPFLMWLATWCLAGCEKRLLRRDVYWYERTLDTASLKCKER
jgi:elongation factor P hydroxylase